MKILIKEEIVGGLQSSCELQGFHLEPVAFSYSTPSYCYLQVTNPSTYFIRLLEKCTNEGTSISFTIDKGETTQHFTGVVSFLEKEREILARSKRIVYYTLKLT